MAFFTFREIREAAEAAGHKFFEPATMRFFRSRLCGRPYQAADGSAFFVTSERGPNMARLYTVRIAKPSGQCETAKDAGHTFQEYKTRDAAVAAAKRAAHGEKV